VEKSAKTGSKDEFFGFPEGKLTPLFKQYLAIKKDHPDCILMYRLGDFYEMFGKDAVEASNVLGIVLTKRQVAEGYNVPMCGIPHHSLMRYVKRLVEEGYKVALCDQLEEPSPKKKLVERGVTRIITAGTLVEDAFLTEDSQIFLMTVAEHHGSIGLATLEASGGRVLVAPMQRARRGDLQPALKEVTTEIARLRPQEVLLDETLEGNHTMTAFFREHPFIVKHTFKKEIGEKDAEYFLRSFLGTPFLESHGIKDSPATLIAIFYLIKYIKDVFKVESPKLFFQRVHPKERLILDERAQRHLELFELAEGSQSAPPELARGLLGLIDKTKTPMGKRLLKQRMLAPFGLRERIDAQLDLVEALVRNDRLRAQVRERLEGISDSERILNRILLNRTNPLEVAQLRTTLNSVPPLKDALTQITPQLEQLGLTGKFTTNEDLIQLLNKAIADEPPSDLNSLGVIKDGYSEELDTTRRMVSEGSAWFQHYEEKERRRTGIRSLKVKRTDAFGWFIEVSKPNLHLVPKDYERLQTLVSAERFVTAELKKVQAELALAEEKQRELEQEIFAFILNEIRKHADQIHNLNEAISEIDYAQSLAEASSKEGWTRPEVTESGVLEIRGGVHPIVQRAVGKQGFVANDAYLDSENVQINIITGPNMGGKSTYMRMVALVVILAQMGCFVPAEKAQIPITDRIFTRIGAADTVATGKSTFMVEMVETAEILNSSTDRSLVILDEVGRGTSTYDGISIARAVLEYLHSGLRGRPKVLFATHYFELTALSEILPRVRNLKVDVRNVNDELVFLYKVVPGFTDESYGVEVAKLAGLPKQVIDRARVILSELEQVRRESLLKAKKAMQLPLFKS